MTIQNTTTVAPLLVKFRRLDYVHGAQGRDWQTLRGSTKPYEVSVDGVVIGRLVKEYSPGYVTARGCVGGSAPGEWRWYLVLDDDLDAHHEDHGDRFFMFSTDWSKLSAAKRAIESAMQFNRYGEMADWEQRRADLFLSWLKSQGKNVRNEWVRIEPDQYGRQRWRYGKWVVEAVYTNHPLGLNRKAPRPGGWAAEHDDDCEGVPDAPEPISRSRMADVKRAVEATETGYAR